MIDKHVAEDSKIPFILSDPQILSEAVRRQEGRGERAAKEGFSPYLLGREKGQKELFIFLYLKNHHFEKGMKVEREGGGNVERE